MTRLRAGIAVVVTAVWAVVVLAPVFGRGDPNLAINAPFMLILGAVYELHRNSGKRDGGKDD